MRIPSRRVSIDIGPPADRTVFGPNENEALDYEASRRLFVQMTETINQESAVPMTVEEVAAGFLRVANENMARSVSSSPQGETR